MYVGLPPDSLLVALQACESLQRVDRLSRVSYEHLLDNYLSRDAPVIVTDAMESWPVMTSEPFYFDNITQVGYRPFTETVNHAWSQPAPISVSCVDLPRGRQAARYGPLRPHQQPPHRVVRPECLPEARAESLGGEVVRALVSGECRPAAEVRFTGPAGRPPGSSVFPSLAGWPILTPDRPQTLRTHGSSSRLHPFYSLHRQNCDILAVKALRRTYQRPYFLSDSVSPAHFNWVLMSSNYNTSVYKRVSRVDDYVTTGHPLRIEVFSAKTSLFPGGVRLRTDHACSNQRVYFIPFDST